jgi:hypothetical protein
MYDARVKTLLRGVFPWRVGLGVVLVALAGASCRRHPPATPANPGLTTAGATAEPARPAGLADVNLSPISGGYQICSPRALHACRAVAVTGLGAVALPVTDIAAAGPCVDQQARATQRCAGAGNAYDASNLRCLAGQGIWNTLLHDPGRPTGNDENQRLTLHCAEGDTWIDLVTAL